MIKSILNPTAVFILLLLFTIQVSAQQTNIHFAGELGGAPSHGFSGCVCGGSIGGDFRKGRFDFSGQFDALRVKKNVGGSGYEVKSRQLFRAYLNEKFFVQGGVSEFQYSVEQFGKSGASLIAGAGVGLDGENATVVAVNYSQQFYDDQPRAIRNKMRTVEGHVQFFLPKHFYLSPRLTVSRFTSGGKRQSGATAGIQIGVWF